VKWRIHLYPVVRVAIDIEAEAAPEAIRQAVDIFDPYRMFPEPPYTALIDKMGAKTPFRSGLVVNAGFAEEYAGGPTVDLEVLVDPLDDEGNLDENHQDYGYWVRASGLNWKMKAVG